jgi:hypothetical protein
MRKVIRSLTFQGIKREEIVTMRHTSRGLREFRVSVISAKKKPKKPRTVEDFRTLARETIAFADAWKKKFRSKKATRHLH